MEYATDKQVGMAGHLLSHMKREKMGIPKVMRGCVDYSGSVLEAVLAQSDRWMVSELINRLMEGQDESALSILNQLGYFNAIDRANAEVALHPKGSVTAMQSV